MAKAENFVLSTCRRRRTFTCLLVCIPTQLLDIVALRNLTNKIENVGPFGFSCLISLLVGTLANSARGSSSR